MDQRGGPLIGQPAIDRAGAIFAAAFATIALAAFGSAVLVAEPVSAKASARAEAQTVSLREMSWLAEAGQLIALTREPDVSTGRLVEVASADGLPAPYRNQAAFEDDVRVGAALFKTPLLLGGQAAKLEMSCHSCHSSGRTNPRFLFPAISREPGTADTTHSFFSKTLGNGVFDPLPIPDLTQNGRINHDPATGELEAFLETLVVDEFGGAQPDAGAIRALATYVRALRVSRLPANPRARARTASRDWREARAMVALAQSRADVGQRRLASLLLAGARSRLALIHERLMPAIHAKERGWLEAQSRALGKAQDQLEREASPSALLLAAWSSGLESTPDFARLTTTSLYDPAILAKRGIE